MTYSDKFRQAMIEALAPKTVIPIKMGLSGRYTLIKGSAERGEQVVAEFDNLITNGGLNRMGSTSNPLFLNFCQVGIGSTTPAFTDTVLANRHASHSSIEETVHTLATMETPYVQTVRRYRFNVGVFNNTVLSEVGIGWASVGSLFSRALILDSEGNPSTLTLLNDEYLDVVYTLRLYVPLSDVTGTVNISGTDYNYTLRASRATTWGSATGANLGNIDFRVIKDVVGYSGNIQASIWTNLNPSGTGSSFTTDTTTASYLGGFTNTFPKVIAGLNSCNFVGGLVSVKFDIGSQATDIIFQIQFVPAIPKTSSQVLELVFAVTWGRV